MAWLLDLLPEYRQYPVVQRHPVVLAFIARHVLGGAVEGAPGGRVFAGVQGGELASITYRRSWAKARRRLRISARSRHRQP